MWSEVSAPVVIKFLDSWRNAQESLQTDTGPVTEYINRRRPEELEIWDVALVGLQRGNSLETDLLGPKIKCETRTASDKTTRNCIYLSTKNRVASRGDEKIGLSAPALKAATDFWKREAAEKGKNPSNVPDRVYRAKRERPLLLIHLLDLFAPSRKDSKTIVLPDTPVVAWGISFPQSDADDKTVEYVVNTTWMRKEFVDDYDEEDMEVADAD